MNIRTGTQSDLHVLEEMLFEAFFWKPTMQRPPLEDFKRNPEFRKLLSLWGKRPGDTAVIAESQNTPIGAAWYRLWTDDNHSYGYVDSETPELAIGVAANHRGKGVGRALLRALIEEGRQRGVETISLSVDNANFARRLYEQEGFQKVGAAGTSSTLLLRL